jgi:peptidoglycan/LPS O-acetylase OafA/YrhL
VRRTSSRQAADYPGLVLAPEPAPRLLPSLTGLRFVAALLVFGRHMEWIFEGTPLAGVAQRTMIQGTAGVSFFYILSGFVLTWSWRPHDTPRAFYRRRFARIYPNYVVAWVLGGIVSLYIGEKLLPSVAAVTLVLLQSWVPDARFFTGMDGVTWSLSCEFFFYALFPVALITLPRLGVLARRALAVSLIVAIGTVPLVALRTIPNPVHQLWFVYIFPPTRLLEFVLGIIVALEVKAGAFGWLRLRYCAILALAGYLVAGEAGHYRPDVFPVTMSYAAFTALPLGLLIAATAQADLAGAWTLVRARWAVRLGEWSYAFYLLHLLVTLSFQHAIGNHHFSLVGAFATLLFLLAVSTAAAALLYTFVERPAERRLRGSRRASTLVLDGVAPSPALTGSAAGRT